MGTPVDTVNFSINGVSHTVNVADYSNHSLASYVREVAGLTGTKVITIVGNYKINQLKENVTTTQFIIYDYYQVSCNEGGCGACIVTVDKGDGQPVRSVNAVRV